MNYNELVEFFSGYDNSDHFLYPNNEITVIDGEFSSEDTGDEVVVPLIPTTPVKTLEQVINDVNNTLTNSIALLKASLINQISGVNSSLSGTVSNNYQEYLQTINQIQETLGSFSYQIFTELPTQSSLNTTAIENARTEFTTNLENVKNLLETQTNSLIQSIQSNIDDVNYKLTHNLNLNSIEISDIIDNEIAALQNNLITSVETINVAIVSGDSILNSRLEELSSSITTFGNQIVDFIDPNKITYIESNNLNLSYLSIIAESEDILDIALLLNILNERVAYQTALSNFRSTLNPWINQPIEDYPLEITTVDRELIEAVFEEVESVKSVLINAISTKRADNVVISLNAYIAYAVSEFDEVSNSLTSLNSQIVTISSDNYISLAEANTLKLSLIRVLAESDDIADLATSLNITTEKIAYEDALVGLQAVLAAWIDKPSYPLAITEAHRTLIIDAFTLVESTKTTLSSKITQSLDTESSVNLSGYVNEQINQVLISVDALDTTLTSYFSDLQITVIEATNLNLLLEQVISESDDLIDSATSLNITAEKLEYSTAIQELSTLLNRWIRQPSYPILISSSERQDIVNKFKSVQDKKSTLINVVRNKQNANTNTSISALNQTINDTFADVGISLTNLTAEIETISSDSYITLAESEGLKLSLNRLISESNDIIALANSISSSLTGTAKTNLDVKLTNYSTSINNLSGLLTQWINQSSYPKTITVTNRTNITDAFKSVESNKSTLSAAVTQALNNVTTSNLSSYVDNQILAVSSLLSGLEASVSAYSSDLQITSVEASNLKVLHEQLLSESTDILLAATTVNVTAEKLAYSTTLTELSTVINAWVYRDTYPLNISNVERQDIINKFKNVQSKKSTLINAIRNKQASNLSTDIANVTSTVNTSFNDLTNSINNLDNRFTLSVSDGYLTLVEANTLELSLQQLISESADILAIAASVSSRLTGADKTSFDTKLINYSNSINTLSGLLSSWINQLQYPLYATTEQRAAVTNAFKDVQNTKSILSGAITVVLNNKTSVDLVGYIDEQMSQVSSSLSSLEASFTVFSLDTQISQLEANTLKLQLEQVTSESIDLINSATLVDITAERLAYSTSLNELSVGVSPWITKIDYPVGITPQERQDIINKFKNVQNAKSVLINAIRNKQTSTISASVDTLSSLLNTSLNDVSAALNLLDNQLLDVSSDNVISFTESESLKLSLNQVLSESSDIISLAASISATLDGSTKSTFDTKLTTYSSAITTLNSLLIQWINQASYPKTISEIERTNIASAFQAVYTSKSVLANAVTQVLDTFNNQVVTTYIDNQILDVNTSLSSFSNQLSLYASDGALTLAEANALKLSLSQIQSESTNILSEALDVGVTSAEKTNYQTALATLTSLVSPWIDLSPINGVSQYPITISNAQRVNIKNAFDLLQSTKTILTNAIKSKQINVNVAALTLEIETSASNLETQVSSLSSEIQGAIQSLHNDLFLEVHQRESLATVVEQYNNTLKGSILSTQSQALTGIGNVTSQTALNLALLRQDLESALGSQVSDLSAQMTAQGVALTATIAEHVDILNNRVSNEVDNLQDTITVKTATLTDGIDVLQTDLLNGFYEANISISDLTDSWKRRIADARVVWDSKTRIGLESQVAGSVGAVFVQEELIIGDSSVDVYNTSPVLSLLSHDSSNLIASCIQPSTEYFIYLANHDREEFNISEIAATETTPTVAARDCRGKLFLSTSPDFNGYMGSVSPGISARIVGQVNTDSTPYDQGGPFFVRELNISWIAKDVSLPETYHEHCDFTLDFIDEETLSLVKVDGLYGQIFVGGELIAIDGNNLSLTRDKIRVVWVGGNSPVGFTDQAILGDAEYYIYLGNNDDSWNFNDINPNTGRPWQVTDELSILFYDIDFDLRKSIFLSSKEHEHGLLSEQYPGYLARYIGKISTDTNGLFTYSGDMSAIRSLQLKPSYLAGLSEIIITKYSSQELRVSRKRGTSGIVMVGSRPIQTYELTDPSVHKITISDTVYDYSESQSFSLIPLLQNITSYIGDYLYIYLTNDSEYWGVLSQKLLLISHPPTSNAYLSNNFPGNTARWIGTLRLASANIGTDIISNGRFEIGSGSSATSWSGSNWSWSSANYNMNFSPVGTYSASGSGQLDCSAWANIISCSITQTTPGQFIPSTIYYTMSFDSQITWKVFKSGIWIDVVKNNSGTWQYYNGSSWIDSSSLPAAFSSATENANYQWTKADIEGMLDSQWENINGWSADVNTINITYKLISGLGYSNPNNSTTRATQILSNSGTWDNENSVNENSVLELSQFPGWKAFNGTNNDSYDCWKGFLTYDSISTYYYIGYSFGSHSKVINKYRILSRNSSEDECFPPRTWTLQGSNSRSGPWTVIDSRTDIPRISPNTYWDSNTLTNSIPYSHYKLDIRRSWPRLNGQIISGDGVCIGELILIEAQTETTNPTFTSYSFATTGSAYGPLYQSLSLNTSTTYQLTVTTTGQTAGYLTPVLGDVLGDPIYVSETSEQYFTPTNANGGLKLQPSGTFSGAVDNVVCVPVNSAQIAGDSITDAVVEANTRIDDVEISDEKTWSSKRIVEEIFSWFSAGGLNSIWNTQKAYGLGVVLEYVNSTTVRLRSTSSGGTNLVFPTTPDYSTRNISYEGITMSVADGTANTRYYVYVTPSSLVMNTTPPTQVFTKLEINGTTGLQVGDICLTAPGSMSGLWNVCSSHNQIPNFWSIPITTSSLSYTLSQLVCSSRYTVESYRTGSTTASLYSQTTWNGEDSKSISGTSSLLYGNDSIGMTTGDAWGTLTVNINGSMLNNSYTTTYSDSCSSYARQFYSSSCYVTARSGSLIIKRSETI